MQQGSIVKSPLLLEDFEAANGYTCILNTLELCTKTGVSQAETVLRCVYSLAFIGPVPLHTRIDTLTIISGSPFQHKNFALPSPGNGSLVRNLNFISLFTEFLKPESFAGLDAERAEAREQISCMLLDTLLDILKSESLNYYIFTSSDLFARLVNSFDLLPEKVKVSSS